MHHARVAGLKLQSSDVAGVRDRFGQIDVLVNAAGVGSSTPIHALELDEFKTKAIVQILGSIGIERESTLIVTSDVNEKLEKSAANIARVGCIRVAGLNVYDILRHDKLVLTKDAVVALEGRLNPPSGEEAE